MYFSGLKTQYPHETFSQKSSQNTHLFELTLINQFKIPQKLTNRQFSMIGIDKSSSICLKTKNAISDSAFQSSSIKPFLNNPLTFTTYTQVEFQGIAQIEHPGKELTKQA